MTTEHLSAEYAPKRMNLMNLIKLATKMCCQTALPLIKVFGLKAFGQTVAGWLNFWPGTADVISSEKLPGTCFTGWARASINLTVWASTRLLSNQLSNYLAIWLST